MAISFHATTICAVRHNGKTAMAGDGQVTMGEKVIMKGTAHKVRKIYDGKVVVGFAGSVADAFNLEDRFEKKLNQYSGNLQRAAVELAQRSGIAETGGIADRDGCQESAACFRIWRSNRTRRRRFGNRVGRKLRFGRCKSHDEIF